MFSAQLKDESESWTAYKFTHPDSGESVVPKIMPMAPLQLEFDSWTAETLYIYVVQATDLGFYSSEGGINGFMNALFNKVVTSSSAAGMNVKTYTVPAGGELREIINPSLPWLAIWANSSGNSGEISSSEGTLRVVSMGSIERGPSKLILENAPTYEGNGEGLL